MEEVKNILDDAKNTMEKCISHAIDEYSKIRAGRASSSMIENVMVDYYGNPTPITQVGNISTPDAKSIVIQPWEKSSLQPIEKAIMDSNLGLTPSNDGVVVRINIPALTEERRKQLVKQLNNEAENARIALRSVRKDSNEKLKRAQKEGLAEDDVKDGETKTQNLTDQYIAKLNAITEAKEKEIMTV